MIYGGNFGTDMRNKWWGICLLQSRLCDYQLKFNFWNQKVNNLEVNNMTFTWLGNLQILISWNLSKYQKMAESKL